MPRANWNFIGNTIVPYLSIDEQKEIVAHIEYKTNTIDKITERCSTEIFLLHELRTRLISDVVTGQMDVRGIAVPGFELAEETSEKNFEEFEDSPDEKSEEN